MATGSLVALLDDIATLMDDVAVLSKVAAKKTAGVLGDDLALNAEQVTGVRAERELPVVWAVFKGSAINKAIMVPVALALSEFLPWTIMPLLMLGGAFLCFEGFEKVAHRLLHSKEEDDQEHISRLEAVVDQEVDMVEFERRRIKGAIRTDAILSAEIIVIILGTVANEDFLTRVAVLTFMAAAITIGVYGFVAGLVKLDDAGLHLLNKTGEGGWTKFKRWWGKQILRVAPKLMKALSVVGTAAMFLVGGGIIVHGIPMLAEWVHGVELLTEGLPVAANIIGGIAVMLANGVIGIVLGGILVGLWQIIAKFLPKKAPAQH
ncbi:MAG: DUF808 domain-containing protein [Pseudomonadota bacterium]